MARASAGASARATRFCGSVVSIVVSFRGGFSGFSGKKSVKGPRELIGEFPNTRLIGRSLLGPRQLQALAKLPVRIAKSSNPLDCGWMTGHPEITPKMEFCPDWRQTARNKPPATGGD